VEDGGELTAEGAEVAQMQIAVNRVVEGVDRLNELVSKDQVDRDSIDEQVHTTEYRLHAAIRNCKGATAIEEYNAQRLRFHVGELQEEINMLKNVEDTNPNFVHKQLIKAKKALEHIHEHAERAKFRRWMAPKRSPTADILTLPQEQKLAGIPWGLLAAVVIDACVDGMLIGLAAGVAIMSGWLMSLATAIEMCFLGYSFACSVTCKTSCKKVFFTLAVPPIAMLAVSCLVCLGTADVQRSWAFPGLIAFALVALLFLVLQELLLEAHETESGEVWHVSGLLYTGLLLSVVLDVTL